MNSSYKKVDTQNWARKRTYAFYKTFDDPYFNITANIDISDLYRWCKEKQHSIFANILHVAVKTANEIDNFRMRYHNDDLVIYDQINGGSTLFFDDGSFGFGYYHYSDDRAVFENTVLRMIEKVKSNPSFDPQEENLALIHFSAIPWVHFSSFKHAQNKHINTSIPRITTGKIIEKDEGVIMPLSVEVNHAIMDGFHVGQYFKLFESACKVYSEMT